MAAFDSQFGRYDVTARLFRRVTNMSKAKQLILLKQLIRDDVAKHLFKLIVDLSDSQQIQLLEQLEEMPAEEMPAKTIHLDEEELSIRESLRKSCLIKANFTVENRNFSSYIIDISVVGVFIETNAGFSTGQKISMTFSLPNHSKPLNLAGEIVWIGLQGIGVKFSNLNPSLEVIIKAFIKNTQRS